MLIACKYEEMYIPQIDDFVYITDEAYTSQEIIHMVWKFLSFMYHLHWVNNTRPQLPEPRRYILHMNFYFNISGTEHASNPKFSIRASNRNNIS